MSLTPLTRIYVGDVMTLIGLSRDLHRVIPKIGQVLRAGDCIDVAFCHLVSGSAAWAAIQAHGAMLLMVGVIVALTPMVVGTLFAHRILRMNPIIICGALAGSMTVDAAVNRLLRSC